MRIVGSGRLLTAVCVVLAMGLQVDASDNGAGCAYSLSTNVISSPANGSTPVITVTAALGCLWGAASNTAWITINSGSAGNGTGPVVLNIAANSGVARSGTVTIAGQTVTITQAAGNVSLCGFSLSPSTDFPLSANYPPSSGSLSLTVSARLCQWSATSSASWLQVFPITGSGNAMLYYTVYPNYGTMQRTAAITAGGQSFTITQAGSPGAYNDRFVGQMYFNFFGNPSSSEVAFHVGRLNAGLARADLVMNFLNSAEFNNAGRYVAGLYVGILDRNAEYRGWLFQRNALVRGQVNQLQLVSNFISSEEFRAKFCCLRFVQLMYENVLLRPPSQAEVDYQERALASGTSRAQLASNFLNSNEFRTGTGPRLTAFLLYATLLQRDPSTQELVYRGGQIQSGVPVRNLVDEMLNSQEFSNLLQ